MSTDPTVSPSSLRTRSSLLYRLKDSGDSVSWDEFYWLYRKLVYGYARRSGLTHEEAEEAAQDVFTHVSRTIHEFECRPQPGSFRAWLMQQARWRIADKFRERRRTPQGGGGERSAEDDDRTRTIERIPNEGAADEIWEREWQQHLLDAALARLSRRAPAKHFQAFDFYARQQWPVLRVSRELGMNPGAVYLISHRLTKLLKAEIKKLEATLG